jgi:hypothetical protein
MRDIGSSFWAERSVNKVNGLGAAEGVKSLLHSTYCCVSELEEKWHLSNIFIHNNTFTVSLSTTKPPSSSQRPICKTPPVHWLWQIILVNSSRGFLLMCLCIVFWKSAERRMRWLCLLLCQFLSVSLACSCPTILLCSITTRCGPSLIPKMSFPWGIFQQGSGMRFTKRKG